MARRPHPVDYDDQTARAFTWQSARQLLDGLPGGRGLNIAHEAVDRHAAGARRATRRVRWIGRTAKRATSPTPTCADSTNRFANVLGRLGVGKGDVVVALAGRIPELYVAALGTLKNGGVFSPLFSAFGPEPIKARMNIARARVLVTTEALYRRKVEPSPQRDARLEHVLLVGRVGATAALAGTRDLHALLDDAADDLHHSARPIRRIRRCSTSRAARPGQPKGAIHVHEAVVAHHITARFALDLHPDDIFWCTADPGWVTGTSYGIIAPLTQRHHQHHRRRRLRRRTLVPHRRRRAGHASGTRRRPRSA